MATPIFSQTNLYPKSIGIKIQAVLTLMLLISFGQLNAKTINVNFNASGTANGTNWTNVYTDFSIAIGAAIAGDEICITKGTYQPISGTQFRNKIKELT